MRHHETPPAMSLGLWRRLLFGALEHFLWLSIQLGVVTPTDELHHFSEGWLNHQPDFYGFAHRFGGWSVEQPVLGSPLNGHGVFVVIFFSHRYHDVIIGFHVGNMTKKHGIPRNSTSDFRERTRISSDSSVKQYHVMCNNSFAMVHQDGAGLGPKKWLVQIGHLLVAASTCFATMVKTHFTTCYVWNFNIY